MRRDTGTVVTWLGPGYEERHGYHIGITKDKVTLQKDK